MWKNYMLAALNVAVAGLPFCHGTHKTKLGYLERGGFICN